MFTALLFAASLPSAPVPKVTRPECDAVLTILAVRAQEPALRVDALEMMGLLGYKKAAPEIRNYLKDESLQVRVAAVAALINCDCIDENSIAAARVARQDAIKAKTAEKTYALDPIFAACVQHPDAARPLSKFVFETIREREHFSGASGLYEAYRPLAAQDPAEIEALRKLCEGMTWPRDDQNDYRLVVALADILADLPKWPRGSQAELERWLPVKEYCLEMECARCLLTKNPHHKAALAAIRKCFERMAGDHQYSYSLFWCHRATAREPKLYSTIGRLAFSDQLTAECKKYFWTGLGLQGSAAKEFLPDFAKLVESKISEEKFDAITASIRIDPALYRKYMPAILESLASNDELDAFPAVKALLAIGRGDPKLLVQMTEELNARHPHRHSTNELASFIAKLDPENAELAAWLRKRLKTWPEDNANPKIRQWNRTPELLAGLGPSARRFAPDLLKLIPDEKGVLPNPDVVRAIGAVSNTKK